MFNEDLWLYVHKYISGNADRNFVVFGTGSGAMKTVAILGVFTENILYFVDNYPKSDSFYGKDVKNAEALKNEINKPFILVASEYYTDIYNQLVDYGYRPDYDFICSIKLNDTTKKLNIATRDYTTTNWINGVKIGRFSYGYEKQCFKGTALKEIGSFCSINESARIGEGNHPYHLISQHPILSLNIDTTVGIEKIRGLEIEQEELFNLDVWRKDSKIIIGNDVWIGAYAVILPGVSIGDGAVIGAGAVVTKNVEPYAIVGGVPANRIKYRFAPHEIEILLKLRWWNWPLEKIKDNISLLMLPEKFFERFECEIGEEND